MSAIGWVIVYVVGAVVTAGVVLAVIRRVDPHGDEFDHGPPAVLSGLLWPITAPAVALWFGARMVADAVGRRLP